MYLSVIIPQFNETESQMQELFCLLNCQQNVKKEDYEVLVVNDHSNIKISQKFVKKFDKVNIKLYETPQNGGSGVCRQYGIENSQGDYVFFIDGDDLIYSSLTISKIINVIKSGDYDIIRGKFLEEVWHEEIKESSYLERNDITWLHGKVYSKKFLELIDLKFPNDIRINEDSYFNGIAFNIQERKQIDIDDFFVIWRYNKNSITRKNNKEAHITGYLDFLKGKQLMLDKALSCVPFGNYIGMVAQTFIFIYFHAQEEFWDNYDFPELKAKIERQIASFYIKYQTTISALSKNEFNYIYQDLRRLNFNSPTYREKETYEEFYEKILKKYEN